MASNSVAYEWYFCDTDYLATPSKEKIVSDFGAVYNSQFMHDGRSLFLFFVSQTQNKLIGLRFLHENAWDYEVHTQIDLSGIITNPAGIGIINEDGIWTGLITSIVTPFKLVRVVFDSDFRTISTSDDLSPLVSLSTPFDVRILRDQTDYVAFVTNSTGAVDKQLARLSFGPSLSATPAVDYIRLPAGSAAASVDFYNTCDIWGAYVSSRNGKVFRIDLGNDPGNSVPLVTELILSAPLDDPGGLTVIEDHNELILILQSRNGKSYTGKLTSVSDNTVEITNLGNINSTSRDWGVSAYQLESGYKVVSASFAGGSFGGLNGLVFAERCPTDKQYSTMPSEMIFFREAGTFKVTLKATNANGDFHRVSKDITVDEQYAPQIAIKGPEVYCVDASIPFQIISDLNLTDQNWDFGDGAGTSSQPSSTYSYTESGPFDVIVSATAENGCRNFLRSQIVIFDKPRADFELEPTLLCTNSEFYFPTTTPDTYDGHLSYEWFVDDNPVSTERDLKYTFISTGPKQIRLKTSIPGCADEVTKTTSTVQEGPVVDFSYIGACEDETFSFHNEIVDPVQSYHWDFGSGQTTNDPDAIHLFPDYGNYLVSLTATNTIGCATIEKKIISVHSRPLVEHNIQGPPNACSNAITLFQNATTNPDNRPITQWRWQFNDPHSNETHEVMNGQHTFSTPGIYPVSLTATTTAGCTATVEKEITIHPSPSTEFTSSPACEDAPVTFTGPPDPSIQSSYWEIGTSYSYDASPTHTFAAPGDYPLYAEFYGANGCISTVRKTIHVPVPVTPDFSVIKNCVDHEAIFTDITNGSDAVATRTWNFGDGLNPTSSPVSHLLTQPGTLPVTLLVTTQSGCSYSTTKQVEILPSPVAQFTASSETGAYPLDVMFANTSINADQYQWKFSDGTENTSEDEAPTYTFSTLGTFDVTLIAYNAQQCEDSFTKSITTVAPLPDADIEMIKLVEQSDGSTKLIVTIHNRGNTVLKDLPMVFDFAGDLSLSEKVPEPILPGAQVNFILNSSLINAENLTYLCVALDVQNDLSPNGNRSCTTLDTHLFVFPAYPNPSTDALRLEWLSPTSQTVTVRLTDLIGRTIFRQTVPGQSGLNSSILDLRVLPAGLYLLVVEDGSSKTVQRIAVER